MSKEHAYAYEAGYRDGSIHYELEHCPACKNVADLQEALAENARLREELEAAKHDLQVFSMGSVQLDADVAKYDAENAKLRELARKLAWCAVMPDCDECDSACEDGDEWPEGSYICTAVDRMMRELGVEVGE